MNTSLRNPMKAIVVAGLLLCSLLVLSQCRKDEPQFGAAAYIKDTLTLPYNLDVDEDVNVDGNLVVDGNMGVGGIAILNVLGLDDITMAGNLTMSTGSLLNSRGAVTVTDDLVLGGNVSDGNSMLRLSENTVVTGTLGVSSQVNAANGVAVTGNITVAGGITATGWLRGYGAVLQPAVTMAITANYGITPGNYSLIFLTDDGGQATGTVTLDNSVSIVDGTYVGQLLVLVYIDTDGATMTIQDAANTALSTDIPLGLGDCMTLVWNGADWVEMSASDN